MPTILVVEDDRFLAKALQTALEKKNYSVDLAYDGVQALTQARQHKPDIILLDILLPLKDGYEVLKDLQSDKDLAHIPVVVNSNLGQQEEVSKALALGAQDYIIKSETSLTDVEATLQKVLKQ